MSVSVWPVFVTELEFWYFSAGSESQSLISPRLGGGVFLASVQLLELECFTSEHQESDTCTWTTLYSYYNDNDHDIIMVV